MTFMAGKWHGGIGIRRMTRITTEHGRSWGRSILVWLTNPPIGTATRDLIAMIFLFQGIIRLIDGQMFLTTPLIGASTQVYGLVQALVALSLLITRKRRPTLIARGAASLGAALCVWLVLAVWPVSPSSAASAICMAWAMFLESRAWMLRGDC